MDEQSKQRIIGAAIWLLLLVIFVPSWYSNPVNFKPEGEREENTASSLPIVNHVYRLPENVNQATTDGQLQNKQPTYAEIAKAPAEPQKVVKPSEIKASSIKQPEKSVRSVNSDRAELKAETKKEVKKEVESKPKSSIEPQQKRQAGYEQTKQVRKDSVIWAEFKDRIVNNPKYAGQWIILLQAFDNTKQANEFARKVSLKNDVYIKYFKRTRIYSVRTKPFSSRAKAEKAKRKLDKIYRVKGEIRQLPKN